MTYFCGPIRNCAPYLDRVLGNITKMGEEVFANDYKIILFYDESGDGTLGVLKRWQLKLGGDKLVFFVNKHRRSKWRTHNIAFGRNACLKYIYGEGKYPLFIMMDFDDVNAKTVHLDVLRAALCPSMLEKWDGLSFNTSPHYYDIWALSLYPYCYSYNHFKDGPKFYNIIKDYVTHRLRELPNLETDLLPCISAFNGCAIYKLDAFRNCWYDGGVNPGMLPENMIKAHMAAAKSPLMFPTYPTADCRAEDCEHRSFHVQAFKCHGAKIRISPKCLFT
jgi:hypothetical protein